MRYQTLNIIDFVENMTINFVILNGQMVFALGSGTFPILLFLLYLHVPQYNTYFT